MDPASVPSNAAGVSADTIMAAAHHFRQRGGELATDAGGMVAAAMAADKEWRAAAAVDADEESDDAEYSKHHADMEGEDEVGSDDSDGANEGATY